MERKGGGGGRWGVCRHHGGNLSSVTDLVTDHIDGVNTLLGASSKGEGRISFRVARLQVH